MCRYIWCDYFEVACGKEEYRKGFALPCQLQYTIEFIDTGTIMNTLLVMEHLARRNRRGKIWAQAVVDGSLQP